jgi:hypothetical protein
MSVIILNDGPLVVYRNLVPETEARLLAASPVFRNPETKATLLADSPVFRDPEPETEPEARLLAGSPSSARIRNTKNTLYSLKDHISHTDMAPCEKLFYNAFLKLSINSVVRTHRSNAWTKYLQDTKP